MGQSQSINWCLKTIDLEVIQTQKQIGTTTKKRVGVIFIFILNSILIWALFLISHAPCFFDHSNFFFNIRFTIMLTHSHNKILFSLKGVHPNTFVLTHYFPICPSIHIYKPFPIKPFIL